MLESIPKNNAVSFQAVENMGANTGSIIFASEEYKTNETHSVMLKHIEVDYELLQSFSNDPLYSALIAVCVRKGLIHIKNQPNKKEA